MITWNEAKNEKIKRERGVSFEEAAEKIEKKDYLRSDRHPTRDSQKIVFLEMNGYVHAVPFLEDAEGNLFLKTIYPSRKATKKWGGGP